MASPDDIARDDFWGELNPGEWRDSIHKKLFGDPEAIKKAYDDMMTKATEFAGRNKRFLGEQQGKALAYYQPMQRMFEKTYGTDGIQGPQVPRSMAGLEPMYGGR